MIVASQIMMTMMVMVSHLAHEVGDDPVEGGALEPEALLPGAEGAEVLRGLGHHVSAQLNRTRFEF